MTNAAAGAIAYSSGRPRSTGSRYTTNAVDHTCATSTSSTPVIQVHSGGASTGASGDPAPSSGPQITSSNEITAVPPKIARSIGAENNQRFAVPLAGPTLPASSAADPGLTAIAGDGPTLVMRAPRRPRVLRAGRGRDGKSQRRT